MFNSEIYDKVIAKEVMLKTATVIDINDDIYIIMKKIEESGQWNLPLVESGIYIGFLSKSTILDKYRMQLLSAV